MNADEMKNFVEPDLYPNCEHLFRYRSTRCSQTPRVLGALDRLHDQTWTHPAGTVIEVGTLYGAFTRILKDHDISNAAALHTFDVLRNSPPIPGVSMHIGDVFTTQLAYLVSLIQQPERAFVFCDGGNKEREVNVLCQHLKPGDLILCHDYVKHPDDLKDVELTGGWPGWESQHSGVKDALELHRLLPFAEDDMRRAMWGCWIKQP